jgi:hypothetical protein
MRDFEALEKELEDTRRKYEIALDLLRNDLPEELSIYVTGRRWVGTVVRDGNKYNFRPSIQGVERLIDGMDYPVFIMEETDHVLS